MEPYSAFHALIVVLEIKIELSSLMDTIVKNWLSNCYLNCKTYIKMGIYMLKPVIGCIWFTISSSRPWDPCQ